MMLKRKGLDCWRDSLGRLLFTCVDDVDGHIIPVLYVIASSLKSQQKCRNGSKLFYIKGE